MISVIIITYQRSTFIQRAINSVLSQTYKDFELIVVDDNNPGTQYRRDLEKIMQQYEFMENVKYIQHEYNKNGAAARNTGIAIAKGEYIAFLDDDDYFMPDRLEKLVSLLNDNPKYNGVYSSVIVTQNSKINGFIEAKLNGNLKKQLLLDQFSFGTGSNLFFRTQTVKELNGFNETFLRHQDIEFMLRFFDKNLLLSCEQPLVVKVQDDRSNEVDLYKLIDVKKNYFKCFSEEIEKLELLDKEKFYQINYSLILDTAVSSKRYSEFFILRKKIRKSTKLSIRNYLRFLSLFVNNYIKIENIKYFIIRKKVINTFKAETNFIHSIEKNF